MVAYYLLLLTALRSGKTNPRFEIQIEQPRLISNLTSDIGSPENGPEIRIGLNQTYTRPESFYKVTYCCITSILDKKSVNPKST